MEKTRYKLVKGSESNEETEEYVNTLADDLYDLHEIIKNLPEISQEEQNRLDRLEEKTRMRIEKILERPYKIIVVSSKSEFEEALTRLKDNEHIELSSNFDINL